MASFNYPTDFEGTFWRVVDGDVYVSSNGNDTTGDGSPRSPYATIDHATTQAAATNKIVVGAGVYSPINIDGTGKELHYEGDGMVTVLNSGPGFQNVSTTNSSIKNFNLFGADIITNSFALIEDCHVRAQLMNGFSGTIRNSVLDFVTIGTHTDLKLYNCTLKDISYTGRKISEMYDCTMDSTVMLDLDPAHLTAFDYCNVDGSNIFLNTQSNPPYTNSTDINTNFSQYQANGLSADAELNEKDIYDFTLSTTSPLLGKGRFSQDIGARGKAISYSVNDYVNGNPQTYGLQGVNIVTGPPACFEIDTTLDDGCFFTQIIDLGAPQKVGKVRLYADDVFSLQPSTFVLANGGEFDIRPNNLADFHNNQVHFGMKWGMDQNDINVGNGYKTFVWGMEPTIDSNGKTNGEIGFDVTTAKGVAARYVQIKVRLTNAGNFLVQEDLDCLLQENGSNIIWQSN